MPRSAAVQDRRRVGVVPRISPFLCFPAKAEEAVNFYVSIFDNSRVISVTRFGKDDLGPEGSVRTIRFQLDGQEFLAANGGPSFPFGQGLSLYVNCDTQAEVDRLWERLGEGGTHQRCGWLIDRFGVSWQIVPTVAWEMMSDPDPVKSQRVMQAIYGMKKIDIAALQQAYNG